MGWLSFLKDTDVVDGKTFVRYCQQRIGTPYGSAQQQIGVNKQIKEFFATYPNANYFTLCRLVDWAVANNRRFPTVNSLMKNYRYAWSAGYLPELDPNYRPLEETVQSVTAAIQSESNPYWITRLEQCLNSGSDVVFQEWQSTRGTPQLRMRDDAEIQRFQMGFK